MERTHQGEFNWTDLSAMDLDAQTAFYESVFGWTHTDVPFGEGRIYRMFAKDGHTVAGASQMNPELASMGMPSTWNTYIAADDIDGIANRAVVLGGEVFMPAADVPGFGRMVGIKDPTGASVFFWKPLAPDATEIYGVPGALAWSDLETRDPVKAADFFGKLLGWDIQSLQGGQTPYWQITVAGQGEGGIMGMPEMIPAEAPAFWLDYFGTDDINATVTRARGLGAMVTVEPTPAGDMALFAVLNDPTGATFAVMQRIGVRAS
jgi:predicted enzyme related to lactoylglutathione lyase